MKKTTKIVKILLAIVILLTVVSLIGEFICYLSLSSGGYTGIGMKMMRCDMIKALVVLIFSFVALFKGGN